MSAITGWIVGLKEVSGLRMLAVGARGVVHIPQFNGKQEGVNAIWFGSTRIQQRRDF
jgi:hypothetical protein